MGIDSIGQEKIHGDSARKLFIEEHEVLRTLAHPVIPQVTDILEDEEAVYVIREYIEGETLEEIVAKQGAQPPEKGVEWGKQLCDALGYLHSQTSPYIHRDIQPKNVMLKSDGQVKIIDFTFVAYKAHVKDSCFCVLLKPGYVAPEAWSDDVRYATRADIYGLGMTMFHLVTGQSPCEPPYEVFPIRAYNPDLPQGLEYIITKCTQLSPYDRYQSCEELMADLNDYLNLPKKRGIFARLFVRK